MNKLRNLGVFSESEYKGKTLQEANKYALDGGFVTRIVEQDGQHFMIDMDAKSNRINFRVNDGIVIGAFGG